MGGSQSKDDVDLYLNRFSESEKCQAVKLFCALTSCNENDKYANKFFSYNDFVKVIGSNLSPFLTKQVFQGISSPSRDKQSTKGIGFFQYIQYVSLTLKGTYEEQGNLFAKVLSQGDDKTEISQLKTVLREIASHLSRALSKSEQLKSWNLSIEEETAICRLSKLFYDNLLRKNKEAKEKWETETAVLDLSEIEDAFSRETLVAKALVIVIDNALKIFQEDSSKKILPLSSGANWSKVTTLLDLPAIWLLNNSLPPHLRVMWHLLFSSTLHGDSFSTLLGHVMKKGPTIIVVKDKDGYVFGGFASNSWDLKPKFTGSETCFVFKLKPDLKVYESSGFNTNYMYLCLHQHTLPNGLGFGGQLNNFGLWIDAEFDHGHSILSCATYQSKLLSGKEQFQVDMVEVWRVGPDLENDEEKAPKGSVLDREVIAKAMMTMVNKVGVSDGLRELGPEDE